MPRRPASAPAGGRAAARSGVPELAAVTQSLPANNKEERERLDQGRLTVLAGYAASPKWSIPQRCDINPEVEDNPGPGSYDVDLVASARRSAGQGGPNFGPKHLQGKLAELKFISPGPAYNTRPAQLPSTRGGCIGVRLRKCGELESQPGPGDYKLPSTLRQEGVVLAGPNRARPSSAPPGPPLYAEPPRLNTAVTPRAWSFGTGLRPPIVGSAAAPDAALYMPPSTMGRGAASIRTGAVPLEFNEFEVRPDPGSYSHRSTLSGRSASFGKAQRPFSAPPRTTVINIGPGSYNPQPAKLGVRRSASLNLRGQRSNLAEVIGAGVPGPGKYRISRPVAGPAFRFGRALRQAASTTMIHSASTARHAAVLQEAAAAVAAATAANDGKDGHAANAVGSGGRPSYLGSGPRLQPRRKGGRGRGPPLCGVRGGPGPGAHDVQQPQGSQRNAVFGTSRRLFPSKSQAGLSPGPGAYDLSKATAIRQDRGFVMKGGALNLRPRHHGPGYYKAYSSFG